MSMNVHITFDYELFFGTYSGSAEKCILEPTLKLLELARKHQVYFTFFVDAGYIYQLQQHTYDASCLQTLHQVSAQLNTILQEGHEIGLHIHPHWDDSFFKNGKWHINTSRYKASDFTKTELIDLFERYHTALKTITGHSCSSYRAGGWCIQPFPQIREALISQHIFTDSSVYKGGYHQFSAHSYDFRQAPEATEWRFDTDECIPVENGRFQELAITPCTLSPFFYWQLYLRMKLNPAVYKPIGDGNWLKDKKKIYRQFYTSTPHFASCDGFFASRLMATYKQLKKQNLQRMVILGHPKSLAPYSFDALNDFIITLKNDGTHIVTLNHAKTSL